MDCNHGKQYRARIEDQSGDIDHSEWFNSHAELVEAMRRVERNSRKTYQCEEVEVRCPKCAHLGATPRITKPL